MKERQKALRKMHNKVQQHMLIVLQLLQDDETQTLDISTVAGKKGRYRCRVGNQRIVYEKIENNIIIHYIGPRGQAYSKSIMQ